MSTTSEKRVLLFAPYFLPRRRVGSMRPFRFAIHLKEFGWEPTVLTIATPGQELTAREAELLRDVRTLTVEPPLDRTVHSESQLGERSGRTRKGGKAAKLIESLDRQFPVDTWLPLFMGRYRSMIRAVRDIEPHAIWATGDPWSGLVVGRWLSRHLGVPYIADFRDPWTLSDVRSDGQWALSRWVDRSSERRVVEAADVVMFQAEQVEALYQHHYAARSPRTVTIRNSFDPDVFADPIVINGALPPRVGQNLHVGFFGRFRTMSPATLMVDALAEVKRRHPDVASRVFVDSFGPLSAADTRYAHMHGVAERFIAHDAVPLERSLSVLRQFDILLVSTDARRDYIIPAKLFEYLPSGRPILSLSRNPEVADLLERTGTGVQMHDPTEVADLIASSARAQDRGETLPIPYQPQPDEIMRHDARASTSDLARVLDSLIDQSSVESTW